MVNWSSVNGGVVNRGVHHRGVVNRGGGVVAWRMVCWVAGMALVLDIGDISSIVVGMVVDMLGPAVRKSNGVGALYVAVAISGLPGIEVCVVVFVMDTILEGVGLWVLLVDRGVVWGGCMVGGGGMDYRSRGMIGWGVVDWGMDSVVEGRGGCGMEERGVMGRPMVSRDYG